MCFYGLWWQKYAGFYGLQLLYCFWIFSWQIPFLCTHFDNGSSAEFMKVITRIKFSAHKHFIPVQHCRGFLCSFYRHLDFHSHANSKPVNSHFSERSPEILEPSSLYHAENPAWLDKKSVHTSKVQLALIKRKLSTGVACEGVICVGLCSTAKTIMLRFWIFYSVKVNAWWPRKFTSAPPSVWKMDHHQLLWKNISRRKIIFDKGAMKSGCR